MGEHMLVLEINNLDGTGDNTNAYYHLIHTYTFSVQVKTRSVDLFISLSCRFGNPRRCYNCGWWMLRMCALDQKHWREKWNAWEYQTEIISKQLHYTTLSSLNQIVSATNCSAHKISFCWQCVALHPLSTWYQIARRNIYKTGSLSSEPFF